MRNRGNPFPDVLIFSRGDPTPRDRIAPGQARVEEMALERSEMRFALNHATTPRLEPAAFFGLAAELGMPAVEIRNDLPGNAILDGTPASRIRAMAQEAGVRILSINALQRFDDWRAAQAIEAAELADYAQCCGAEAVVLVSANDGSAPERLLPGLAALGPMLGSRGLKGLIEPLGFPSCTLRFKAQAEAAIAAVEGQGVFRLIHDTFHHRLSGEVEIFPGRTGLVHVSGVDRPGLAVSEMVDADRGLVGPDDRLGTLEQLGTLVNGGYAGFVSIECFAPEVQALADPRAAIRSSVALMREGLGVPAA